MLPLFRVEQNWLALALDSATRKVSLAVGTHSSTSSLPCCIRMIGRQIFRFLYRFYSYLYIFIFRLRPKIHYTYSTQRM